MLLECPPLTTALDLPPHLLVELDSASPQLRVVMTLAQLEKDQRPRTAANVAEIMLDKDPLPFEVEVMIRRMAQFCPQAVYSAGLLGTMAALTDRVAVAVMWCHTVAAWWQREHAPATVGSLLLGALGGCHPTTAGWGVMWDAQKVDPAVRRNPGWTGGDNWLDKEVAWQPAALLSGLGAHSRAPVADLP